MWPPFPLPMAVIGWSDDEVSDEADTGGPARPTTRVAPASTVSSLRMHFLLDPRPQAEVLADKEAFVSAPCLFFAQCC